MPLRTGNTYVIPGGRGVANTKTRTVTGGRGPVPKGTRRIPEPAPSEVPTLTTSGGRVTSSGFGSPQAASRARRASRAAARSARLKRRALNLGRQNAAQRRRAATPPAPPASRQQFSPAPKFSPAPEASKPAQFQGQKTAGTPSLKELRAASRQGALKTNKRGYLTTPKVRKAAGTVRRLESKARRSTAPLPGLTPQASHVARKVLARGAKLNATRKQKLAAAETGLVESGFENLPGGTSDSEGWRQERASLYPNPRNVKASATRFFRETKAQRGATAGELAANVQRPAEQYRGRYDERKPEAAAILRAFNKGSPTLAQSKRLKAAKAQAAKLGLRGPKKKGFRYANPLPVNAWTPGRSDQGFDASPRTENAPIVAVSKGKIIAVGAPGWPGGGGVTYKILRGPQKGKEIYAFESVAASVRPGQIVKRGQVIGRYKPGYPSSIETGYYEGNPTTSGHPLHNQLVSNPSATYSVSSSDGQETIGSAEFKKQILGQAVNVPATGGTGGYFVTAPTVGAYAAVTGTTPQQVGMRLKSHKLSVMQIFRKLKALGVEITPAGAGQQTGVRKAKLIGEEATSKTLKELEARYGVKT